MPQLDSNELYNHTTPLSWYLKIQPHKSHLTLGDTSMKKATVVYIAVGVVTLLAAAAACYMKGKSKEEAAVPAVDEEPISLAHPDERLQEVSITPAMDGHGQAVITQVCEMYNVISDFLLSPRRDATLGNVSADHLRESNQVRPLCVNGHSSINVSLEDILLVTNRPERYTRKDDKINPQIYVAHCQGSDSAFLVIKMDDLHFSMYAHGEDFVAIGPKMDSSDTMGYLELVMEKILLDWGLKI
jgi:hypothetical protein